VNQVNPNDLGLSVFQPVMTSVLLGSDDTNASSRAVTVTVIDVPGAGRAIRVPVVSKQYGEQVGTSWRSGFPTT
jgi:hypothetical protein